MMIMDKLKLIQVNLNKSSVAGVDLQQKMLQDKIDIALITEPNVNRKRVTSINFGSLYYDTNSLETPRACIVFKTGIDFIPLAEFC